MSSFDRIHLINIEQKISKQDEESGEMIDTWEIFHENVFASIKDLSVRGFLQSKAEQTEVSARIEIDYLTDIDDTMRLVGVCGCHSGKVYNPVGILADDKTGQEYLTIPCKQGVNYG